MDYLSLGFNGGTFFDGGGPSPFGGLTQDQIDSGVYDPIYNPSGDANLYPGIYSPPITGPTQPSQWPQLIAADIAAGLKTISNIFAPASATAAQALASQPQYQYRAPVSYYPGTTTPIPTSATSAGIDSTGLNLFGSHIGWWPIAIVAVGFYLLQSRPVGRR